MNSSLSIQINLGFPNLLPQKGKDVLQSVTCQESLTHWWDSLAQVAYLTLQPHVLIRIWFWRPIALASLSQSFILRLTRRHLGTHRLLDQAFEPFGSFNFFVEIFHFFICCKRILNCLLKDFNDDCFRILVTCLKHQIRSDAGIRWVSFLLFSFMLGCSWLWAWGSLFSCVLDIVDTTPGDCLLKPSISAARHFN